MAEVKGESTRRFWMPVCGVIHEPRSVTSDVQAISNQEDNNIRPLPNQATSATATAVG